jgi:hypothetical protein
MGTTPQLMHNLEAGEMDGHEDVGRKKNVAESALIFMVPRFGANYKQTYAYFFRH